MTLFKRKKKNRVCVVGLDGVPYTLIKKLTENGTMPFLAKIVRKGQISQMKVTLPEISSVSWSSFMTGTNPGQHGIFGFVDLKPNTYRMSFPSFRDLKTSTFWDKLGKKNKRCIVINQPSTYPARDINGVMVSGFVAIEMRRAVYPATYCDRLEQLGYQIDVDTEKGRDDVEFLFKELHRTLGGRKRAADLFWEKEDWDYFQVVVTGTDRLQHFLWDAVIDERHAHHHQCMDYYKKVDQFIGGLYNRFCENSDQEGRGFFLLSDHGFTLIKKGVYLNRWLEQQGYLKFDKSEPESMEDICEGSKAFVMDPGRIYINVKGKFPKGCVPDTEVHSLRQEIKRKLIELEFEGEKVIQKVVDREEIYSGPYSEQGPDMVVLSHYGFDLKGSVKQKEIFGDLHLVGMHTWDDAFFWSAEDVKQNLYINDLAELIMKNVV